RADLPEHDEKSVWWRLIAGEAFGVKAKAQAFSQMFYLHGELQSGATMALPDDYSQRAAYVVTGTVEADGRAFHAGQMLVFGKGPAAFKAISAAKVMMLGGEPIGPRFSEWNCVSAWQERTDQA